MNPSPRVSVVIPVLNGAATIGDTLAALQVQAGFTLGGTAEVIVVDNGSTDATVEIAQRFPVRVVVEPQRGASAARNRGLQEARAPIVAYTDADTLPTRRWLAELIAPMDYPKIALVAGKILSFRPETVAERYVDASGLYDPRNNVQAGAFRFAVSMNMAVRRDVALRIGGWATDLPWGEDVDFSHRLLREQPEAMFYAERALLFHRNRSTRRALARQAFGYGHGAACLYRKYPETARLDLVKTLGALGAVARRSIAALGLGAGALVRLVERDRAALATCHAIWAGAFWYGFFRRYWRRSGGGAAP